jgi:LuxR family transcriptional regulator, maltose regulon positive regulatory protein
MAHARQSLDLFVRQSCYWGQATVYDLMHFIHRKNGESDAAARDLENGFRVLENTDLPFTQSILEIGRLSMLIDSKQLDGVRKRLATVSDKVGGSFFYAFKVHLLSSKLEWYRRHPSQALENIRAALELAGKYGYEQQLAHEGDWINSLIDGLPTSEIGRPWVRRLLDLLKSQWDRNFFTDRVRQGTEKTAAAALAGHRVAPGIRIFMLGHFNLNVGDKDRPMDGLRNAKARMMIKYLAAMHNHGYIHRDEIIELLWPEQDFNKTRKRFNVAVSAIRKFFEPYIKRGQPSAYLKKQGVSFRLDPGDGGGIDVHDFMDQIKKGDRSRDPGQAIHHYLAAQQIYGGPFLVEEPYTQWCRDERRNLQHKYLTVLWKIICHFHDQQDYTNGIFYADQYLGIDDSAEHVYQKLMGFHAMAGNRSEIKKVFEKCRREVSDSLGCPLHPKTLDLYHSLLQQP